MDILAALFIRDLKTFIYRLYGSRMKPLQGRVPYPITKIIELVPENIVDIGCGYSIYSYQLAVLAMKKYNTNLKLILVDRDDDSISFHKALVEGKQLNDRGFERWKKWVYEKIDQKDLADLSIEILKVDLYDENPPSGDIGIASYLFHYFPLDKREELLGSFYDLYNRFLVLHLGDYFEVGRKFVPPFKRKIFWKDRNGTKACLSEFLEKKFNENYDKVNLWISYDNSWENLNFYYGVAGI